MMNQEGIFKKVGQILNELQDQYDFLARNPSQLNDLELELFMANANFLSDHVQIVKKFNSNKPLKEIPEHAEDQSAVTVVTEREPEQFEMNGTQEGLKMEREKTLEELEAEYAESNEPIVNEPVAEESSPESLKFEFLMDSNVEDDKFEFEQHPIETIFDRPLSKEEEEIIAEKQRLRDSQNQQLNEKPEEEIVEQPVVTPPVVTPVTAAPVVTPVEEAPVVTPVAAAPVVAPVVAPVIAPPVVTPVEVVPVVPAIEKPEERVTNEPEVPQARPTLNDLLASRSNASNSLNDENSGKVKITDLKQAINLNEKLLYIKDLFNGYNLAYAEAIELINKMPDLTTADSFLQNNYAVKNNWADKQSTVDKFYDLLNQRFDVK